jgi:hypothetical protein
MGHDISLEYKKERLNCFPSLNYGNQACKLVDGKLVPLDLQDRLSITYNNSEMWYLAMKNIGHPVDDIGEWLDKSKAFKIIPILENLLIELTSKPEIYEPLQPEPVNGKRWGGYLDLCQKIQALLIACRTYPMAEIYDFY